MNRLRRDEGPKDKDLAEVTTNHRVLTLEAHLPSDVIREISPHDSMYGGDLRRYLRVGESALECIGLAMLAAGKEDAANILDFGCGHGRVLRALKAAFPGASLTACDIDLDGIDFCSRVFGATPIQSQQDPDEIELNDEFDLIWCGSVLTHVNFQRWLGFLGLFEASLAPAGLLIFTTHGRHVAERIRRRELGLTRSEVEELLRGYDHEGFGYVDYAHQLNWGNSLSSPAWVCAQLARFPDLRLLTYTERGWGSRGRQDCVACVRSGLE